MDYEQFKESFAEDLKTNLQKLGIEADVSEHHIEKLKEQAGHGGCIRGAERKDASECSA